MITICYISTYLNHHNKPVCDELYDLTNGSFFYVATSNIGELRREMGFSQMQAEYLLDYTVASNRNEIKEVINTSDVVLIGASEPINLIDKRLRDGKLTFRISERLFKTKSRYIKAPIHWLRSLLSRKAYMLCCSAATASDYNHLGFYKNRCFKWGYFTEVKELEAQRLWKNEKMELKHPDVSILWVGRLIGLKHPESAVLALHRLKKEGYSFHLNIIGDGPVAPKIHSMVEELNLNDSVHLLGAKSTEDARRYMEKSEVFLFTSNREEGWGAVLNESMSCACAVIANSEIGSVPFLLKNGENGLIYSSGSIDSLYGCLKSLMDSIDYRKQLGIAAYESISRLWTPRKAAENLLTLVCSIRKGVVNPIREGPCSVSK